jgi:predicted esterase
VAQGRKALEVLTGLMGDRAEWHEYPGLGHGISDESLAAAVKWVGARLADL